jgi:dolichol-phosphate mannosyltransferase
MDKRVVAEVRGLTERSKFLRGLVSWVGFRQCPIQYHAAPRFLGTPKYTLWKMIRFGLDGLVAFSAVPLHVSTIFGLIVSLLSFGYAAYALYVKFIAKTALPGWTSVLVAVLFVGGVQLLRLGVGGEYLRRIYIEVKSRPVYIVRKIHGEST